MLIEEEQNIYEKMFNFFKKKPNQELLDFSELGTDIHSHLIPGIDDGADDLETSLRLIAGLKALGFKKLITTPHVMSDYYQNERAQIEDGLILLREEVEKAGLDIEIQAGAEYYLDNYFDQLIEKEVLLTLSENYVLVEISFFSLPINLHNYIFKIRTKGYKPILAHPERYLYFKNDFKQYFRLKELGCSFQVNILSLTGHYGSVVKAVAEKLLKNNLVDFLGTDLHHLKHLELLKKSIELPGIQKILANKQVFYNDKF